MFPKEVCCVPEDRLEMRAAGAPEKNGISGYVVRFGGRGPGGWGGVGGCFGAPGHITYSQKKSWASGPGTWRRRRQTLELVFPDAVRCPEPHQLVREHRIPSRFLIF